MEDAARVCHPHPHPCVDCGYKNDAEAEGRPSVSLPHQHTIQMTRKMGDDAAAIPLPLLFRVADVVLLPFFLLMAVAVPLLDLQICLPPRIFPHLFLDAMAWYFDNDDDYLKAEKPAFFVAAVWVVILLHWPLVISCTFGMIARKSWYPTTCLVYGVSVCSVLAPVLGDMIASGKASDKMLRKYASPFGAGLIAILRGLFPHSSSIAFKKNKKKIIGDDHDNNPKADVARMPLPIKVADAILLIFFILIVVFVALIDVQICLPPRTYPQFLVNLKEWYIEEFDDYLMVEKPAFFVAAVCLVILFQWPLAIASILGLIGRKSWYPTTCLMYGISACSVLAPVLGQMIGSGKASSKMFMIHSSVLGPASIAILRGLIIPPESSSSSIQFEATHKKRA